MLLSEAFNITRTPEDDWFDPILNADTKLFVDPFLIFEDADPIWSGAHAELISLFNAAFALVAEGRGNQQSLAYRKALAMLRFPEPREFCLGYTARGTAGSGGSEGLAALIARAMDAAIDRGVRSVSHFEELGILNDSIGADRISDLTCTFLKTTFIGYTQRVAERHNMPVEERKIFAGSFDRRTQQWLKHPVQVPINALNGRPVLLTPQRFLRDLPTLDAHDWFDWYQADQVRTNLNYEVMRNVDKATIVEIARRHPDLVEQYAVEKEGAAVRSYDLDRDPAGVYQWDRATREYVTQNPLVIGPASAPEEFFRVIETVVARFRLFVEERAGWRLLWDGPRDKPEEAAQLLFRGIAGAYCEANGIVVDREVELGRGPVDFKFSNGYSQRALLEIKKLHNSKFWNGLRRQLPSYLVSDDCQDGWFLAIQYRSGKVERDRLRDLPSAVSSAAQSTGKSLRYELVDARQKQSASAV